MRVSQCVFMDGWPKKEFYLQHLWAFSDYLEGIILSILAWRPYKEPGPHEIAKLEVGGGKDKTQ